MKDPSDIFEALARSKFRRRFALGKKERALLESRGLEAILVHAKQLIGQRLAPAAPPNDGRQTPMRGHPVFVAQHATATCCRGCLQKWHNMERGRTLTAEEQRYVVHGVIRRWLLAQGFTEPPTLWSASNPSPDGRPDGRSP